MSNEAKDHSGSFTHQNPAPASSAPTAPGTALGAIKPPLVKPPRKSDADRLAEIERKIDRLVEKVDRLTADREMAFRTGGRGPGE